MGLKLYDENDVQNIANAIREKGVEGSFKMSEMPNAISQISGGIDEEELLLRNMEAIRRQQGYNSVSGFIVKPDADHYFLFNTSYPVEYGLKFKMIDKNFTTKVIGAQHQARSGARGSVNMSIEKTNTSYPFMQTGVPKDVIQTNNMFTVSNWVDKFFDPDRYLFDTGVSKIVNLNPNNTHPIINEIYSDEKYHNVSEITEPTRYFKDLVNITPHSQDPNFDIVNGYVWAFGNPGAEDLTVGYYTTNYPGSLMINASDTISAVSGSSYIKNFRVNQNSTFINTAYYGKLNITVSNNSSFSSWSSINRDNINDVMWYNTVDILDTNGDIVKPANITPTEFKALLGVGT